LHYLTEYQELGKLLQRIDAATGNECRTTVARRYAGTCSRCELLLINSCRCYFRWSFWRWWCLSSSKEIRRSSITKTHSEKWTLWMRLATKVTFIYSTMPVSMQDRCTRFIRRWPN